MIGVMNVHVPAQAPKDFVLALRARESSLRNLASTLCRNRDRAECLLSHVMAKAQREHATFDRKTNFATWVMRMMREEFTAGAGLEEVTKEQPTSTKPDVTPLPKTGRRRPEPIKRAELTAEDALRLIDITPYLSALRPPKTVDLGPAPNLAWLEISLLRIDQRYQREILRRGRNNVIRIAAEFDWRKFTPVIVARIAGTPYYGIVDGQHRTTAAACRSIVKVPCMIIDADPRQQAAAFAAINGNVTQMSSLQLHAARIAAGDPVATGLDDVCGSAGVEIMRYPVPANLIKPGQTLAVSCLASALKTHGPEVLNTALLCITATGDGNVGLLRAPLIRGLCQVLAAHPKLAANTEEALRIAETIDFGRLLEDASVEARRARMPVASMVVTKLATKFGCTAAKAA